ncbi:unnamed protein product [Nesidiocoris tenuis]|uniref:Uncharacterized protein n=1 Tax=Nesidiocoris tenuis TaxID=355587 RepID=A0A6H5GKV0_9HEMI|nr:unnamed protein product [Nesidiocoris tenuis]
MILRNEPRTEPPPRILPRMRTSFLRTSVASHRPSGFSWPRRLSTRTSDANGSVHATLTRAQLQQSQSPRCLRALTIRSQDGVVGMTMGTWFRTPMKFIISLLLFELFIESSRLLKGMNCLGPTTSNRGTLVEQELRGQDPKFLYYINGVNDHRNGRSHQPRIRVNQDIPS